VGLTSERPTIVQKPKGNVKEHRPDVLNVSIRAAMTRRSTMGVLIIPYSPPGDRFQTVARAMAKHASRHPRGLPPYRIDFLKP